MTPLWTIGIVILGAALGAIGQLFLKKSSGHFRLSLGAILTNYNLIIGFILYAAATLPFIYALKFGELNVLYPFVATSYIWTSLLAMKYLDEKMNKWKWLGIVFIIFGVSLIAL